MKQLIQKLVRPKNKVNWRRKKKTSKMMWEYQKHHITFNENCKLSLCKNTPTIQHHEKKISDVAAKTPTPSNASLPLTCKSNVKCIDFFFFFVDRSETRSTESWENFDFFSLFLWIAAKQDPLSPG